MNIENLSLQKLKTLAKSYGVIGYSKYTSDTKDALINQLVKHMKENKTLIIDQDTGETIPKVKRKLFENEIQNILESLPTNKCIPEYIRKTHIENIQKRVRQQLESIQIYPEIFEDLKNEILKQYNTSKIQPGESVGIITAQSIGERQTQMTLDTFHSAGAALKTVITGVPRFSELLSATTNPKSVISTIYTNTKYSTVSEIRNEIGRELKCVIMSDIISDIKHNNSNIPDWYWVFESINGDKYKQYTNFITLEFNISKLFENKLSLDSISNTIENTFIDLLCVYSPTFIGRIDVYFSTENIINETDTDNCINTYIEKVLIPNLEAFQVSGITEITDVFYDKKDSELFIETTGSNLKKLFNNKKIDETRTVCNNMWEILKVLGVEAARDFLIEEFQNIISSDGTYVNKCHIELLVDVMTFNGNISSISRYGQRKSGCGPLAKASFEESLENFIKAGVYGETENTTSISSSIMIGKIPNCGTGIFDIFMDTHKILNNIEEENIYNEDEIYEL